MAVKNQTHPETKLSTKSKSSEFSFNLLIKSTSFIFFSIKIRLEMAEIAIWLRKTKPNKPNRKPDQPNRPKPPRSLIFCELSLHAKFQFPRLCLSYISTQDSYIAGKNQANQTKPKKPNQPSCLKPLGLSYFCELSLHTKFQLPRLCLSCISMVEDGEKKEEKRRISSFNGYLSHSSSRVEFELGLGLRLTNIEICHYIASPSPDIYSCKSSMQY